MKYSHKYNFITQYIPAAVYAVPCYQVGLKVLEKSTEMVRDPEWSLETVKASLRFLEIP